MLRTLHRQGTLIVRTVTRKMLILNQAPKKRRNSPQLSRYLVLRGCACFRRNRLRSSRFGQSCRGRAPDRRALTTLPTLRKRREFRPGISSRLCATALSSVLTSLRQRCELTLPQRDLPSRPSILRRPHKCHTGSIRAIPAIRATHGARVGSPPMGGSGDERRINVRGRHVQPNRCART